jgi:cell division protein FtsB
MATRRPKVPSAQFHAGVNGAPGQTGKAAKGEGQEGQGHAAPGHAGPKSGHGPGAGAASSNAKNDDGARASAATPVPARSFNGRLLVVGLVMAVLTVLLAPNIHTFMEQRAEISALKADIATKTAQQGTFKQELARWDDPEYVRQQARDRVSMLMPGETGYWVYGANGLAGSDGTAATPGTATSAKNATVVTTQPWVDGLWASVQKSAET